MTTTLFTAVATFAAVTGVGALILAAWQLRNRGKAARQTVPGSGPHRAAGTELTMTTTAPEPREGVGD